MSPRREVTGAVLLCLAGAFLALVSGSQAWVRGVIEAAPPLPVRPLRLAGGDLVEVRPLALLGLAAVPALAATRGWGRWLVGAVTLLAGAGVVLSAAGVLADPTGDPAAREATRATLTPWPWACLVGGALLVAAGLLVTVRGRRWAALPGRYEAPAARAEQHPADVVGEARERALWEALDRGEDPTRR